MEYRSIQFHFDRAFKRAGLSKKGSHLIRHSFATTFLEATNNIQALQKLLGHSRSQQTEHYAKLTETTALEGYKVFNQEMSKSMENVLDFPEKLARAGTE